MALIDTTVRDLLNAFSSSDPTPGGGSASALASSVGVSLLMMVAGLPKTKHNTEEDRVALDGVSAALTGIRQQLAEAIDTDTAAYDAVVTAYKLPKATDAEKGARKDAIQRALKGATDVPLVVMRLSAKAFTYAATVDAHGLASAASDVGVAKALLRAGLEGARLNVEINLGSIADETYTSAVRTEIERLTSTNPGW
jgi:formiminotetrahydrofolate cyclodeaminase